ncbi:MAG: hypothetical protein WBE75_05270 [Candidatus Omnitrophota bacterium]|jgi:hypothetical protein
MEQKIERDLGEQPIAAIMAEHDLKTHDLVAKSIEQLSHKMVARAVKGRRLTPRVKNKVLNALNKATEKNYSLKQLFNY